MSMVWCAVYARPYLRVCLAGDAARTQSPFGAQGMDAGIVDAANLAWRIALVVRGGAAPALVDGYDMERRGGGVATAALASRLYRLTNFGYGLDIARHVSIQLTRCSSPHHRCASRALTPRELNHIR